MSETAATRLGSEAVLATAGLKKTSPTDKKEAEGAIDTAAVPDAAEPRLHDATALAPSPVATASDDAAPKAAKGSAPAAEVELKLIVDADRLADFNNAPVMTANARNKGSRKHLRAAYYDTSERTLWRNRLTLRVRQSGARYTQTVKAELGDDPLRRGEWEASVPSMTPDLALAMPFIPEKIRSDLEVNALEPVFTTDIRRHQRMVEMPSGTVEVAFDQGMLKAGPRTLPVSEIELELKQGSAAAIYELALRLAEHGPVKPSIRTKSARGFDLAADKPPSARKPG